LSHKHNNCILLLDGTTLYTFEYPVRSNTGIPFRESVITYDANHLVVPAAEKSSRDYIMVYNAKTGANINKIPIKLPGFKVYNFHCYSNKLLSTIEINNLFK
jgi:hypothetical protein